MQKVPVTIIDKNLTHNVEYTFSKRENSEKIVINHNKKLFKELGN